MTKDYRSYSLWLDAVSDDLTPRAALGSVEDVDVAIVGGGYTGLWTAYYLAMEDPSLRVAIVEADIAGFGASGRNGGWCSALMASEPEKIAKSHGRQAAVDMQREMFATIDEVGRVIEEEGIDAPFAKGGTLTLATRVAHVASLRSQLERERSWGWGEDHVTWLESWQARGRVNVEGCLGALYTPHCAAIDPARLVRGLARKVEALGVRIYEQTPALAIAGKRVRTPHGRLDARVVVRATEGYTPKLVRHKRCLLPIYSLMIATEPLPASFWDEVGWEGRETLTDGRHLIIYAQRTADDRIAIGGRGAPYHFGSRLDDSFEHDPHVFDGLHRILRSLFPGVGAAEITHRWGGPLGASRDWQSSVGLDEEQGIAWAGGYVGDGVATTNLAGRTLRDLILGRDTELVRLPWVNHRSRRWEPEPLRWVGARLALLGVAGADRSEERSGRPSRRAELVGKVIGRRI